MSDDQDFNENVDQALTSAIMRATSGSACSRSEEVLVEYAASALDQVDMALEKLHLEDCESCSALLAVIVAMDGELPEMREIGVPPAILDKVLAMTSGKTSAHKPLEASYTRQASRFYQWLSRPRLAAELSFACTCVVMIVFGISRSNTAVPAGALQESLIEYSSQASSSTRERVMNSYDGISGQATKIAADVGTFLKYQENNDD